MNCSWTKVNSTKIWKVISVLLLTTLFSSAAFASEAQAQGLYSAFDGFIGQINGILATLLFWDVLFFIDDVSMPFTVAWLIVGATYFTFRMGFINVRAFRHAIDVTRGKYDDDEGDGEVSHFQALTTALSATVGLGNIAGVAIAISVGGPGATFWMIVAGFLGMSSKFVECSLGQMYRRVDENGKVMGGAMEYLSRGLAEKNLAGPGKFLAVLFCLMCIGGSFGGGNAFQVNQALNAFSQSVPVFQDVPWLFGLIMAGAIAVVIIGGVKRIASTAEKIVPLMCGIYVAASLWIILVNLSVVPEAFGLIVKMAFSLEAGIGGLIGVLVQGFRRAAFSNEAGIGSAAIAHSAAKTKYPVREGIVSLLEPFIDTVVICTMTALVIVITGAWDASNPTFATFIQEKQGAALTGAAFGSAISWFPLILSISVVLFAYSTMISWSYYGERCWTYLFGEGKETVYRMLFVIVAFLASVGSPGNIIDFSDLMILGMSFPNIFGLYILSGKVKKELDEYMAKMTS